ncbi:MAG TPA: hypothetical protein VF218_06595 [Acidothermaceae bacterium]|jgi:hypothetical protein
MWWPGAAGVDARERGDIILGWLTKLVIGISIAGVVAFDGVSIGVAHVSAIDDANSAALAASRAWQTSHDMSQALQAAQQTAAQHGETVIDASLHFDGDGTAHIDIQRDATTLIVRHIHALRSWIEITATGSGRSVGE